MSRHIRVSGLLLRAISDWYCYADAIPVPLRRAEYCADKWGVSAQLLHKATQEDFTKRADSY